VGHCIEYGKFFSLSIIASICIYKRSFEDEAKIHNFKKQIYSYIPPFLLPPLTHAHTRAHTHTHTHTRARARARKIDQQLPRNAHWINLLMLAVIE